jgi:hypothetical protein
LADSGIATFENLDRNVLPFLRLTPMPILFVGLDFSDSDTEAIRHKYDLMYDVATSNGVNCLSSDVVFGNSDLFLSEDSGDTEAD